MLTRVLIAGLTSAAVTPQLEALFRQWFKKFDDMGMTVVTAAGNEGCSLQPNKPSGAGGPTSYLDIQLPKKIMTDDSPFIVVGGTYHNGEVWHHTTPGRGKNVVSLWAQAVDVWGPEPGTKGYRTDYGTSYATPCCLPFGLPVARRSKTFRP